MHPLYLEPDGPLVFPDPHRADAEGLVAVGGDLSPERLALAYSHGIFPWYDEGVPPLWWSPDPRCVLPVEALHVSRRLQRRLSRHEFRLTWNTAFVDVMRQCARDRAEGTWILPEMETAYATLHELGQAHSLEVWVGDDLVGGLYGVQQGGLFAAESMFHHRTDASKIALVAGVRSLFRGGIEVFDVQFLTPHLESMGALCWPRAHYLEVVEKVGGKTVELAGLRVSCDE